MHSEFLLARAPRPSLACTYALTKNLSISSAAYKPHRPHLDVDISKMIAPVPRLFFLPFLIAVAAVAADPPPGKTDLLSLLSFKHSLSRSAPGALSSWNPAGDPCSSWGGVSCRGGRIARLVLEGLRLDGPIHHLARLPHLSLISLSNNSFSSPIHRLDLSLSPWQAHLKILHLSHNRFSGPFPVAFLRLRRLRRLNLAGNLISGAIPSDIGVLLLHLLTLRLEENELSGTIPTSIGSIPGLTNLNVSRNRLSGAIPSDLSYFQQSSFAANSALCGIPLPRRCPESLAASRADPRPLSNRTPRRKLTKWTVILAAAAGALAATTATTVAALFRLRRWAKRKAERTPGVGGEEGRKEKKRAEEEEEKGGQRMEWFEEESGEAATFALEDLMQGSAEMLGRGAVGSTYRVVMEEAAVTVVVKRVRRPKRSSSKDKRRGMNEEEALLNQMGRWRHPNVVSLRAYHYSSSGEELLLVYDYLPSGSLFDLLHGNRGPGRISLEWPSRLKLVLDAANGLAYLHGVSNSKLSHHHLTSSNILVDTQGNARISDFALLDLVSSTPLLSSSSSSSSSFNSASSRAVAAAATSTETVSRNGDIYCFGVILLEVLTGRPGGEDLAKWVQTVVREEWTSEVFDIELMRGKAAEDEMFALLQVALLCVAEEAKQRPRMGVVYKMIEDIRERGNRKSRGGGGPISPSLQDQYSGESTSPCLSEDTPTVTSS